MTEGKLPKGWARARLGDICMPIRRAEPRTIHERRFTYIDISSIDSASRKIVSPQDLSVDDAPSRARQIVCRDDVLFSTVRPYLRNIASVSAEFHNQFASTGFSVIRGADGIDPRYLFHLVNWSVFINQVLPFQRGSSYPAVRDEDVKSIIVSVPPKEEQKRIAAKIDELFSRLDSTDATLKRISGGMLSDPLSLSFALRQSILATAFRGELAPGGADEEWADDLLARIRAQRIADVAAASPWNGKSNT